MKKIVDTYTIVRTLIKETAQFLCSEFFGVNSINTMPWRYTLQSLDGHCKGTLFF